MFVGTTVIVIHCRVSKSHRIPQMKQFRANTAHNSCSKAGSSVLGQSKCLGSIRHAMPHVRLTFVLQNSRKLLKTLDRRQPLHCRLSYCLLQIPDDFPWMWPPALCNICCGGFRNKNYLFSSKAIFYELCQCGIHSVFFHVMYWCILQICIFTVTFTPASDIWNFLS